MIMQGAEKNLFCAPSPVVIFVEALCTMGLDCNLQTECSVSLFAFGFLALKDLDSQNNGTVVYIKSEISSQRVHEWLLRCTTVGFQSSREQQKRAVGTKFNEARGEIRRAGKIISKTQRKKGNVHKNECPETVGITSLCSPCNSFLLSV